MSEIYCFVTFELLLCFLLDTMCCVSSAGMPGMPGMHVLQLGERTCDGYVMLSIVTIL